MLVEAPTNAVELRARYRGAHSRLWGPPPTLPRPAIVTRAPAPPVFIIDDDTYFHLLDLWMRSKKGRPTGRQVCERVARHFSMTYAELSSERRHPDLVLARWVAMFICRRALGYSYPLTGRTVGRRNHATVYYGERKISARMAKDPALAEQVNRLVVACGGYR